METDTVNDMVDNPKQDPDVRDLPKTLTQVVTFLAVIACLVLAFTSGDWEWGGVGATVLLVGLLSSPDGAPGSPGRWTWWRNGMQALGLGAIPAAITLAIVDSWWWAPIGAVVLLLAIVISTEMEKPQAGRHG